MAARNRNNKTQHTQKEKVCGGVVVNGVYTEFKTASAAVNYLEHYFAGIEVKDVVRVGDVHKVADYGNLLPVGARRTHWRDFIVDNFDFLLSYIGGPGSKVFNNLLTLSAELNKTIFLSYMRGRGENKNNYHEGCSKAWYLNKFSELRPQTKFYLLDDGDDHVSSVNNLHNHQVQGILVQYNNLSGRDIYRQITEEKREQFIREALKQTYESS